eukprot:scaffold13738_cov95-Isochrysis_galbana.AAC.1
MSIFARSAAAARAYRYSTYAYAQPGGLSPMSPLTLPPRRSHAPGALAAGRRLMLCRGNRVGSRPTSEEGERSTSRRLSGLDYRCRGTGARRPTYTESASGPSLSRTPRCNRSMVWAYVEGLAQAVLRTRARLELALP